MKTVISIRLLLDAQLAAATGSAQRFGTKRFACNKNAAMPDDGLCVGRTVSASALTPRGMMVPINRAIVSSVRRGLAPDLAPDLAPIDIDVHCIGDHL